MAGTPEPMVERKAKPDKHLERHIYGGGTPMCDYGGDCWGLVPHCVAMAGELLSRHRYTM
jgi:hypothetical protein